MAEHVPDGVRLQKVLASAGVGSRRRCEELIAAGRVTVGGGVVREQGLRVDPGRVVITVDGTRIHAAEGQLTVAVNKPKGVVSTMSDPQGRPALDTLVARFDQRLFHVGRLDSDTSGLILLTNDGDLANRLAHPSHGVEKVYVAKVAGRVPRTLPATFLAGVELDDGPAAADACVVKAVAGGTSVVEVTLHEGRNRIVRRMFDAVGYPVIDLSRVRFGPISLGALGPGKARALTSAEVGALLVAAGLEPRRQRPTRDLADTIDPGGSDDDSGYSWCDHS